MDILPLKHFLAIFLSSLALSLVLTPLMRKTAVSLGRVAVPKDDRWHSKETALLGGGAIFAAFAATWVLSAWLAGWSAYGAPYLPVILCATGIFVLGLVDDMVNIGPQHKLGGQIIAASILVSLGFRLGWVDSETIDLFLSILWIVGITNAFNLLDNMDGLSAGIAFIAAGFVCLTLYLNPSSFSPGGLVLIPAAAYLGATLGFLVYNFYPASIFMGDAGSLFIGFVLACMTMISGSAGAGEGKIIHLLSVIAIPILIVFIPILDTGFVSLMRKLFRRRISEGGRDHSSHRMVAIGFSEKKAVMVLYGFSMVSGMIALGVRHFSPGPLLVVIALFLLFVCFFWLYLAKVKVYPEKSILSQEGAGVLTPVLVEVTYRRRLFEVLLDLILIVVAYYAAYLLRFEGVIGPNFDFFLKSLPILIACQILCFHVFGVYSGIWASTSIRDLIGYIKAVTAGTVLCVLILLGMYRFQSFSRAVFGIYWGLMLIFVSLSRLSFRLMEEGIAMGNRKGKPCLIYGAGVGGQMTLKEIETNDALGLYPLGFIDDNPNIRGRKIKGYTVFGGRKELEEMLRGGKVKEVIISFKENGPEKRREVKRLCTKLDPEVNVRQMTLVIS